MKIRRQHIYAVITLLVITSWMFYKINLHFEVPMSYLEFSNNIILAVDVSITLFALFMGALIGWLDKCPKVTGRDIIDHLIDTDTP